MRRVRLLVVLTGAVLLNFAVWPSIAGATVTPSPSTVTTSPPAPLDAVGCTGVLPTDQIENCVSILGDASYLESVAGSAYTHFGSVTGHEEITGPSIPNGYLNSSKVTITTGTTGPLVSWDPDGPVESGNYCAIFWQNVGGGYSENGPACEDVT